MTVPKAYNVLWHSNSASSPAGYGNQTNVFTPRIKNAGHGVVISGFYGAEGSAMYDHNGIKTLPRGMHPYGNDALLGHFHHPHHENGRGSDLVISLLDPFVLDPAVWGQVPWAAWTPVDGAPVFAGNVKALKAARWVWSMSKFGHEELQKSGFHPLYVPHGIETQTYKPIDRALARKLMSDYLRFDLTGKYIVTTVAANKGTPSRKNFVDMMEAFALYSRGNPGLNVDPHPDAVYYIHSDWQGVMQGENLRQMAEAYGVADKVLFPNQYEFMMALLTPEYLNNVYNASDVFMLLSSEGFGIPTVEAQAAGCPVLVADYTASPELCFSGKTVIGTRQYIALSGVWWYKPVILDAVRKLVEMYAMRDNEAVRSAARVGAMEYDADHVFETYMLPSLEVMFNDLERMKAEYDVKALQAERDALKKQLADLSKRLDDAQKPASQTANRLFPIDGGKVLGLNDKR